MIKKIFSDTAVYAFIPQLPKVASFFILPILTKDLTELDYGISAIVYAYIGGLIALKTIGLEDVFINYYFKHPKLYKKIWAHFFGFLSSYMIIFAFLIGLVLFAVLPVPLDSKILIILLNVSGILLFDITIMFGSRYLQLKQKPLPISIISAVSGITVVFLNLYTISYLKLGYLGWFISTFISSLIQFVFYAKVVFVDIKIIPILKFRYKYIRKYLKISAPLIPNKYGHYLLNSSDRIVMDLLRLPITKLGLYNFGYNLGNYLHIFVSSIGIAVGPTYLQLLQEKTTKSFSDAKKITIIIQAVVMLMTIFVALWMKQAFDILVSNDNLRGSYDIAIIVVMSQNYAPYRFYFTNVVVFNEKTKFLWKITFVAGIINVVLNLIFIKAFGIRVAAITTFISMFYITIVGFYHKSYKEIKNIELKPLRVFFISSFLLIALYLIKDISIIYKAVISIFVILVSLITIIKLKSKGYFDSIMD